MNTLIVISHPLNDSLCKHLAGLVETRLKQLGHKVTIEDLYAEDFKPALTVAERKSYYAEQYDSSDISLQQKRLQDADAIVLLFPTWWFGFPAMLKGWFDRVWGPGIAYDHASDFGPIKPRLNNLKKVLVITTLGSPWWVDRLIMRQPVKRILKLALLGACAAKSRLRFLSLYNSEQLTEQKVLAYKDKIEKELKRWRV